LDLDLDRPTGKDRLLIESEMAGLRNINSELEQRILMLDNELLKLKECLEEEVSEKERYRMSFLDAYHNR
jgi:hypothetical protein